MKINEIFEKSIDRNIQGVVQAGQKDEDIIQVDLDEYVVTKEVNKYFNDFFHDYAESIDKQTTKIGVWISGFFGSGKSHFMKILYYFLSNIKVNNKHAVEYFTNKIDDEITIANIKKINTIKTDAIIFNIDAKSDDIHSSIKSIFLKVFYEMQGLDGNHFSIAELELDLIAKNLYDKFKEDIKKQDKQHEEWERVRTKILFKQELIKSVLVNLGYSEDAVSTIINQAISNQINPVSAEEFAWKVHSYIEYKEKTTSIQHHVVFLVDEIGQYIGDDGRLMLELQTIVEELGDKCKGKAWVIVTSQEAIDKITEIKGNDFSKIQGRFATRISLSSANVGEVIKTRILKKNQKGSDSLSILYTDDYSIKIKNLISFNDNKPEKRNFNNREEFVEIYPFIPYQLDILGDMLTQIRINGATGRHLAEGERSMLSLFQEAAIEIKDKELGSFVSFDAFYNAIEEFLDHTHRCVIEDASKLEDNFTLRVLKTLFLIKYVDKVPSTLDNLTSLLIMSDKDDRLSIRNNIKVALDKLYKEMFIQYRSDEYIFLTNEEQEVNNAINNQEVAENEIAKKAAELIFDDLYRESIYQYNHNNFSIIKYINSIPYKTTNEKSLAINIIFKNDSLANDAAYILQSQNENNILIILSTYKDLSSKITRLLKIGKYLRNIHAVKNHKILEIYRSEQEQLLDIIKDNLKQSLNIAKIYVAGEILDGNKSYNEKINSALGMLCTIVYNKNTYIKQHKKPENIIEELNQQKSLVDLLDDSDNQEFLQDLQEFITEEVQQHLSVSIKNIRDRYKNAPYGFNDTDISWALARLFVHNFIIIIYNGQEVDINDDKNKIYDILTSIRNAEKVTIKLRKQIDISLLYEVRILINDIFGESESSNNEDVVKNLFLVKLSESKGEMEQLVNSHNNAQYPGITFLKNSVEKIKEYSLIKDNNELFTKIKDNASDLKDIFDKTSYIKGFFTTKQLYYYDEALEIINIYDNSRNFILSNDALLYDLDITVKKIKDIISLEEPYRNIKDLPGLNNNFKTYMEPIIQNKKDIVKQHANDVLEFLLQEIKDNSVEYEFKNNIDNEFKNIFDKLERASYISILEALNKEIDLLKDRFLNSINKKNNSVNLVVEVGESQPEKRYITLRDVISNVSKKQITNEEDLENFLEHLKEELQNQIKKSYTINIDL